MNLISEVMGHISATTKTLWPMAPRWVSWYWRTALPAKNVFTIKSSCISLKITLKSSTTTESGRFRWPTFDRRNSPKSDPNAISTTRWLFGGSDFLVRLFLLYKYPVPTKSIPLVLSVQFLTGPTSFFLFCFVHIPVELRTIMSPICTELAAMETFLYKFFHHRITCTCIYCVYRDYHTKMGVFLFHVHVLYRTDILPYCSLWLMVDHSQHRW